MGWSSSRASAPLRSGGAQTPPRLILKSSHPGQHPAGHVAGAASQEREPGGEPDPTRCRPTPEAPAPLCSHCEAGRSPQPQRAGLAGPCAPHRPPLWADGQELPTHPAFMPACLPGERITWEGGSQETAPGVQVELDWEGGGSGGPEPQPLGAQAEDASAAAPAGRAGRAHRPGPDRRGLIPAPLAQTSGPSLMDGPTLLLETGARCPACPSGSTQQGGKSSQRGLPHDPAGNHSLIHPARAMMH